jgi:hypothetical protein
MKRYFAFLFLLALVCSACLAADVCPAASAGFTEAEYQAWLLCSFTLDVAHAADLRVKAFNNLGSLAYAPDTTETRKEFWSKVDRLKLQFDEAWSYHFASIQSKSMSFSTTSPIFPKIQHMTIHYASEMVIAEFWCRFLIRAVNEFGKNDVLDDELFRRTEYDNGFLCMTAPLSSSSTPTFEATTQFLKCIDLKNVAIWGELRELRQMKARFKAFNDPIKTIEDLDKSDVMQAELAEQECRVARALTELCYRDVVYAKNMLNALPEKYRIHRRAYNYGLDEMVLEFYCNEAELLDRYDALTQRMRY